VYPEFYVKKATFAPAPSGRKRIYPQIKRQIQKEGKKLREEKEETYQSYSSPLCKGKVRRGLRSQGKSGE